MHLHGHARGRDHEVIQYFLGSQMTSCHVHAHEAVGQHSFAGTVDMAIQNRRQIGVDFEGEQRCQINVKEFIYGLRLVSFLLFGANRP